MFSIFINEWRNFGKTSGNATRTEFWLYMLCYLGIFFVYGIVMTIAIGFIPELAHEVVGNIVAIVMGTYSLASIVPGVSIAVRRLHDSGRSGWNLAWCLLPLVGTIIVIVLLLQPSKHKK